jgi:hypothetical protein
LGRVSMNLDKRGGDIYFGSEINSEGEIDGESNRNIQNVSKFYQL